jgi:hypothetical protein
MACATYHDGDDGPQLLDDFSGLVKPAHMRVTGSEGSIRLRKGLVFLNSQEKFRHGLIEPPAKKMCLA